MEWSAVGCCSGLVSVGLYLGPWHVLVCLLSGQLSKSFGSPRDNSAHMLPIQK